MRPRMALKTIGVRRGVMALRRDPERNQIALKEIWSAFWVEAH
jgi:hypothetical protein